MKKKFESNYSSPSNQQLYDLLKYFKASRYVDAEKLSLSITREFPKNQLAWKVLGAIFNKTGRIKESLVALQKSVHLNPQDSEAHKNLGIALEQLGILDKAEASYNKAILLESEFIDMVNSINKGDWENSKDLLSKICTNKITNIKRYIDGFIKSWCLRGRNLLAKGDIKEFSQIYVKLLMIGKKNSNLNNLTKFLFETVDINLILKLVETNNKILIKISYCQYKFENKDFLLSEELAAKNIQDAKNLIKNTVTEDLGWLVVSRSLALCKNKNFARKILNNFIKT
ncbi:hypothetical protein ABXT48_02605 [Candidatus Pelagibacter sp. Uisw_101]|uniref:tetratricopeptide repeat protein n=1 Tax=Candidatus Pelagibacter sp. Uisw_101 TaxID=3230982 RepID=UPI0039ECB0AE